MYKIDLLKKHLSCRSGKNEKCMWETENTLGIIVHGVYIRVCRDISFGDER